MSKCYYCSLWVMNYGGLGRTEKAQAFDGCVNQNNV